MNFVPTYDERNRANLAKLGDRTRTQAMKWYQYLIDNKIDVLIYEATRTLATQKENIKKGVSWTLRTYHLESVGQAFDFVPVLGKTAMWASSNYKTPAMKGAIAYAKKLGFSYGGDWTGTPDYPHLQYDAIGYGTDTFTGKVVSSSGSPTVNIKKDIYELGDNGAEVKNIQSMLVDLGYKIQIDSIYGKATEDAVKDFQAKNKLAVNGKVGGSTLPVIKKAVADFKAKDTANIIYKQGDKGDAVKTFQESLNTIGNYGLTCDGIYGQATVNAVKDFQTKHGLEPNGMIGASTRPVMNEELIAIRHAKEAKETKYPIVGEVIEQTGLFNSTDFRTSTRIKILNVGESYKIYGEQEDIYLVGNGYALKKSFKIK